MEFYRIHLDAHLVIAKYAKCVMNLPTQIYVCVFLFRFFLLSLYVRHISNELHRNMAPTVNRCF